MRSLLAVILLGVFGVFPAAARSSQTLASLRDVIYTPQGQPFSGTITFIPEGFAPDDRPPELIIPVSDGMLSIKLATTSSQGASYAVTYVQSDRVSKWTEIWQVPAGDRLKLADVRTESAASTAGDRRDITLPVSQSNISGLSNAITQANASLTALAGQITKLASTLTPYDIATIIGETPAGTVDGTNASFMLANVPVGGSLELSKNGVVQILNQDYSISSQKITFTAGAVPAQNSVLSADYRLQEGPILRFLRDMNLRAITLPIPISSVSGLNAALSNINTTASNLGTSVAAINSVVTTLTSTQPVVGETPAGTIDGKNTVFKLAKTPSSAASVALFRNGVRNAASVDYSISGQTVTFAAGSVPQAGDLVSANYQANN